LQGEPVESRIELMLKIGVLEPAAEVELEVGRAGAVRKLKVTLAQLPEGPPPKELPPARENFQPAKADGPQAGPIPLKVPEFPNEAWAYVPESYDPACLMASWCGFMRRAGLIGRNCWPAGNRSATATT